MADRYWVSGSGNWNDTNHWASASGGTKGESVPSYDDDVYFDSASWTGNYTATLNVAANVKNFTFKKLNSGTATFSGTNTIYIRGNIFISGSSGINFSNSKTWVYDSTGSYTIERQPTNAFNSNLQILSGSTVTFLNAAQIRTLTLTTGSVVINNLTQSFAAITSTGNLTRSLDITNSQILVGGTVDSTTSTAPINIPGLNLSIAGSGSEIIVNTAGGNAGLTLNQYTEIPNLYLSASSGNRIYDFSPNNHNRINVLRMAPSISARFSEYTPGLAGYSTFVKSFQATGNATGYITIETRSSGTGYHNLRFLGTGYVSCDYLIIKHSIAEPGALTWFAGANSINSQSVSSPGRGWIFSAPYTSSATSGSFFNLF